MKTLVIGNVTGFNEFNFFLEALYSNNFGSKILSLGSIIIC